MNRKLSLVFLLIAAVLLLCSCSEGTGQEPAPTAVQQSVQPAVAADVVATVDGVPVYKEDFNEAYAYYMNYYAYYYGEDLTQYESEISEAAMQGAVDEQIFYNNLESLGYLDYSIEQYADAEAKTQEDIEYYADLNYSEEITAQLGEDYTPEEYTTALAGYEQQVLDDVFGMTRDEVVEYYLVAGAKDRAYADIMAQAEPTRDEVEDYYNGILIDYRTSVTEDPSVFISDSNSGFTTYYTPEGVRMVRQILIKLDDETSGAVALLRDSGYDESADLVIAEGLKGIKDEALDILSQLKKGKITFSEAIEEYNEDTGMPENGYAVIADNDIYITAFTDAAMLLEEIGDITAELVQTDYGYHIIEYYGDTQEGELSLDDVYDEMFDALSASLGSDAWDETVAQWRQDAVIVYYYENIY